MSAWCQGSTPVLPACRSVHSTSAAVVWAGSCPSLVWPHPTSSPLGGLVPGSDSCRTSLQTGRFGNSCFFFFKLYCDTCEVVSYHSVCVFTLGVRQRGLVNACFKNGARKPSSGRERTEPSASSSSAAALGQGELKLHTFPGSVFSGGGATASGGRGPP